MIRIIIPARGGSKGITLKNLTKVGEYSLLEHTIADALSLGTNEIYVSTEDKHIAHEARRFGVNIIDRPLELCGDNSSSEDAIKHVIKEMNIPDDDTIVFLQCTSPFRANKDLVNALKRFNYLSVDSLFSCYEMYPFLWNSEGRRAFYHYTNRPNRQNKDPVLVEDGSFYISKAWCYTKEDNRLSENVVPFAHDKIYGFEIDSDMDLVIANTLYPLYKEKGWI
ncbi:MAG: acylneuraminate cytidylyltransferase family protein [Chloroflexi bacterium]|nr:MAG: acylneuraminate cytidylyltransferase family protein [Chloroflexota bacterium]